MHLNIQRYVAGVLMFIQICIGIFKDVLSADTYL